MLERVLEQRLSGDGDLDVAGESVGLAQISEMSEFPPEAALIRDLRTFGYRGLPGAGVTEGRGSCVVIHEVSHAFPRVADLPPFRQRVLVL